MVRVTTDEGRRQRPGERTKPIQTFFADTKVCCVQARDPATGNTRHWVCKSPAAQQELQARLEKDPECWVEVSSYHALVHDEGDTHDRVPK